jgi:hypothetical protein
MLCESKFLVELLASGGHQDGATDRDNEARRESSCRSGRGMNNSRKVLIRLARFSDGDRMNFEHGD